MSVKDASRMKKQSPTPTRTSSNLVTKRGITTSGKHGAESRLQDFGHDLRRLKITPLSDRSSSPSTLVDSCPIGLTTPTRCPFGGACHACPVPVQAKLKIGKPDDEYEREADRVADQVMSMPDPAVQKQEEVEEEDEEAVQRMPRSEQITPLVQRQEVPDEEDETVQAKHDGLVQRQTSPCTDCDEESIQTKRSNRPPTEARPGLESQIHAMKGSGRPLSRSERDFFEPRFGYDFSEVRVHTDGNAAASARSLNARAYTVGQNISFSSGGFHPGSLAGRKLMAHELAHVVQQTRIAGLRKPLHGNGLGGPVIQRALKCSLDHIKKECKGAASKCSSIQNSYCKKKYPKPKDIEQLHKNAVAGAKSKKKKIPHAAANLLHFLSASGSEKVMPVAIFKNHKVTKDQLTDVHREKFIKGAQKRLKSGKLKPGGGSVDMIWTDTANAFSFLKEDDLGYAVGGYTLCSKVTVTATNSGKANVEMSFDKWTVQAFDCYNWDPGKGIGLPGADDNDLCCLQNAGKGKHFRIKTDPWNNSHAPSMSKATIK